MTLYFAELDFGKHGTDWVCKSKSSLILDIISGEIENVQTVLEVHVDEDRCRVITEDVAREVRQELETQFNGCPEHLADWIDQHCGAGTRDALNANAGRMEEVAL